MKYLNKDVQFWVKQINDEKVIDSFNLYAKDFKNQDSFSFGVDTPIELDNQKLTMKYGETTLRFENEELYYAFNNNYYLKDNVDIVVIDDTPPIENDEIIIEEKNDKGEVVNE